MAGADFDTIRRELSGLRKRASDLQDGNTKGVEVPDSARYMLYAIDRIAAALDAIERSARARLPHE